MPRAAPSMIPPRMAVPTIGIAVSQAWSYQVHPDPLGKRTDRLVELCREVAEAHLPKGET